MLLPDISKEELEKAKQVAKEDILNELCDNPTRRKRRKSRKSTRKIHRDIRD